MYGNPSLIKKEKSNTKQKFMSIKKYGKCYR